MRWTRRRGIGHEAEGGRAVVLIVLVVLIMGVGGWVAAYAGADGRVPRGTSIAGIDIGGRDRPAAVRALADGVRTLMSAPMTVTVGTVTTQVSPAQAGLSVDAVDSVAKALGPRSWEPRTLWSYYTGGGAVDPVITVDSSRMDALLDQLDQQVGQAPRDGSISLSGAQIAVTKPRDGAELDHDRARAALVDAWAAGRPDVTLPLVFSAPDVDAHDVDAAVTAIANPAVSGPVTLVFAGSQVVLAPRDFADLLIVAPHDGALALDVDPDALAVLVDPAAHDAPATDASVALDPTGQPAVVPAVDGQSYDAAGVAAAFLSGVTASGAARTVEVQGTASKAGFTTRDARRLGVAEPVATWSVPVPSTTGPSFADAVARLNGAVVRPGDTFSFNGRVGQVNGSGNRLATATWNAGFLAGLTDVARTAPATAGDGLPSGRDAAVAIGGADLQLRNDTSYGVLLSARVDGGSVVVDAWSTKQYDVTATTGAPYAVTPRATVTDTNPTCVAAAGADGFAVDLVRTVTQTGDPTPVRSDTVTTIYAPQNAVVCAAAPPAG